jgi:hypothetical protein
MKRTAAACVMFVLLGANWSFAQSSATPASQHGRTKMWIGATLMTGGALVVPVTALGSGRRAETPRVGAGLGLMSAGGVLLLWGAHARRQPAQPQTSVSAVVGRQMGVEIRRVW